MTKNNAFSVWYAPPELILNLDDKLEVSTKSDIWSFGCLIYQIFSNKKPWKGQKLIQIFNQMTNKDPFVLEDESSMNKDIV